MRDSRCHALTLSTAGRFSSTHTFLLFNDCFVHLQVRSPETVSEMSQPVARLDE